MRSEVMEALMKIVGLSSERGNEPCDGRSPDSGRGGGPA